MKNKRLVVRIGRFAIRTCFSLAIFFPALSPAQALTAATFFRYDTIPALYLGIDFTKARLINDDISKSEIIQGRQFNGINDLMIKEYKKYDFQGAWRRFRFRKPSGIRNPAHRGRHEQTEKGNDDLVYAYRYGREKSFVLSFAPGRCTRRIGFRNYWSSAINSTIIYFDNKCYTEWKEKSLSNK